MKELEIQYIGKGQVIGFIFTQIKSNDKAYIYEVDTNGSMHYEVFKRMENRRFNCVSYPTDAAFGVWAKTTTSYSDAVAHFEYYTNVENLKE